VAIDAWTSTAGVTDGHVYRSVNRADRITGEGLGEKVVWQLIKPYADASGVPGIAPHDLRRTCAKLRRAGGAELEQIQLLLGHASSLAGSDVRIALVAPVESANISSSSVEGLRPRT
jgi:integrase